MSCICNLFRVKSKKSKVNNKIKKLNINDLNKADNKIPLFSLDGTQFKAKVVNVYDGDTIKVVILFNNKLTRFNNLLLMTMVIFLYLSILSKCQ